MKQVILKTCRICGFLILLLMCIVVTGKIVTPKWLSKKDNFAGYVTRGFYDEKKDSLDVLFIGNSDVYSAVSPMELWEKHGITSYIYAVACGKTWNEYYLFLETMKKQKPEVVFFDVDAAFDDGRVLDDYYCRSIVNSFYLKTKLGVANKLTKGKGIGERIRKKVQFILPLFQYHSRIYELKEEDFEKAFGNVHYPYKGYVMRFESRACKKSDKYMEQVLKNKKFLPKAKPYVDKIVEYCKNNKVKLILTEMPTTTSWNRVRSEYTQAYAKEKGLEFIDFNRKEVIKKIGINWNKDTYDKGNHLNIYGAVKTTGYIGNYLKENFKLKNHKNDKKYAKWHDDYKIYLKNKNMRKDFDK